VEDNSNINENPKGRAFFYLPRGDD